MAIDSLRYSSTVLGLVESVVDQTISANVCTSNLSTGNVGYIGTAPSANFTLNVTNVPVVDGTSITVTTFVVQGATGYYPSALQIDGGAQTIKWSGGAAPLPTSTAGKIDIYSFTLVRRSSTWTVFGSALTAF